MEIIDGALFGLVDGGENSFQLVSILAQRDLVFLEAVGDVALRHVISEIYIGCRVRLDEKRQQADQSADRPTRQLRANRLLRGGGKGGQERPVESSP